jgi:2-oxo-3-hexenedioate decarboxylase
MADYAKKLDEAALSATAIAQLRLPTAEEGYEVQADLISRRVQRGEVLVGFKMGLTSRAKMAQVGVDEVIMGRLTDGMRIDDGDEVDVSAYIHPRVEPEIAFLIREGAIQAVAPALEIIDSRYANFEFTLPDVVADNTSGASFVVGAWQKVPADVDNLGVLLEINGEVVQVGSTAAILGDPRRAFTAAQKLAMRYEMALSGILLAGAATAAVPLKAGSYVRAVVQGLGSAALRS